MQNGGWICLSRKLLDWEWYQNNNVKAVFIHCLLKANYEEKKWQGHTIQRGEFITSYDTLSSELGMPRSTVRDNLMKLRKTGEISVKSERGFTRIKCLNYSVYQDVQTDVRTHSERQANTNRTSAEPTNNNNNNKKYNNKKRSIKREPNFDINELYERAIHTNEYDI